MWLYFDFFYFLSTFNAFHSINIYESNMQCHPICMHADLFKKYITTDIHQTACYELSCLPSTCKCACVCVHMWIGGCALRYGKLQLMSHHTHTYTNTIQGKMGHWSQGEMNRTNITPTNKTNLHLQHRHCIYRSHLPSLIWLRIIIDPTSL